MKNDVAAIKHFKRLGLTQKQIRIVTGCSATQVSNVWNDKYHQSITADDYEQDPLFEYMYFILMRVMEKREIPGIGELSEQDKAYISLLRACQVDYRDVKKIYEDRPVGELRAAYHSEDDLYKVFDGSLIGLLEHECAALIEQLKDMNKINRMNL